MRVYADLFFLLNAGADYVLLLAAGRLAGVRTSAPRLLGAAAFGGIYALGSLLLPLPVAFSWPGTAGAGALLVLLAYAPRPVGVLLRLLGLLYATAALAAGLALLAAGAATGLGAGVPWWGLALALGGTLAAGAAVVDRRRTAPADGDLTTLEIEIGGRRTTCQALLDSGNRLSDPCGDGPAIIVPPAALAGLLPDPLLRALPAGPEALAAALAGDGLPPHWARRFRLLPYRAVGTGAGILPAIRPDGVWLGRGVRRQAVRAVIAVSPEALDPRGAFTALVPAGLWRDQPAVPARGGLAGGTARS